MLLYIHRDQKDCWGRGAQDYHLDFHTASELWTPSYANGDFSKQVSLHSKSPTPNQKTNPETTTQNG